MKDEPVYDIAIIGGGLAGLSLAIQCAGENYKVILLEKEVYPFHKVCGEYISLESLDFLRHLGIDPVASQLPFIDTLHLSDSKGSIYSFGLPLGGFGISRFSLDYSLYQIAQAKGVQVKTNATVRDISFSGDRFTISTSDELLQARVVSGAYGKRSNLDKKLKRPFTAQIANRLNNYIGIKYHVEYEHDRKSIVLHNFNNGYCGLSAIEDGKSCLCYLTTAQNLNSSANSIPVMERTILYKNPRLKEVFTSAKFLFDKPLAISQISFQKKSQVEDHILMSGDAAGMISPLCGNGMSMAMHASKLAFNCIHLFLSNRITREMMEKEYQHAWSKAFSKRLWMGRTVQNFFGGNTSTSMFLKIMHSIPAAARLVISSTHGTSF